MQQELGSFFFLQTVKFVNKIQQRKETAVNEG